MKFLLRAVICIALIVGIIFGVSVCKNKKTNELIVAEIVISKNLSTCYEQIEDYCEDIQTFYDNSDVDYPTTPLSSNKNKYDLMKNYFAEIYFAKNVKDNQVKQIESFHKNLNNLIAKAENLYNQIKKLNINTIDKQVLNNFLNTLNEQIYSFNEEYVEFINFVANYIKSNVYNNSESYKDLNDVINSI